MTDGESCNGAPGVSEFPPIVPGLFRLAEDGRSEPSLLGGRCPECGGVYFPRPKYCPKCLGETAETALASRGSLYSYTVVRTKAPLGLPEPYGLGLVDLEESGLRVFGLLDPATIDQYRIGQSMRLAVAPMGTNVAGSPCLRPFFTPMPEPGEGASR